MDQQELEGYEYQSVLFSRLSPLSLPPPSASRRSTTPSRMLTGVAWLCALLFRLTQVKVALKDDPTNGELSSLQSELEQLIDLCRAAIQPAPEPFHLNCSSIFHSSPRSPLLIDTQRRVPSSFLRLLHSYPKLQSRRRSPRKVHRLQVLSRQDHLWSLWAFPLSPLHPPLDVLFLLTPDDPSALLTQALAAGAEAEARGESKGRGRKGEEKGEEREVEGGQEE
jgi:hypothetical protein